jgi:hypothetical protein
MPIPDFDGSTFVAFTDISGFKQMMKKDQRAIRALDHFYSCGFSVLRQNQNVHGIFISDCGVLFSSDMQEATGAKLESLLKVIEQLNRQLLEHDIMLTTSIAYGRFSYHQRVEFDGIEKNPVYGNAYTTAFLDNESGQPPIQPGECRIVKRGLDSELLQNEQRLVARRNHLYFYWMVSNKAEVEQFMDRYADAYEQKYRGMLGAIKHAVSIGR